MSSELFNFEKDVYFCNTYILPQGSTVLNHNNFDFFEQIESDIEKYKPLGKIFLIGDLNSRTSNISDILDYDSYLDYFDSDLSNFVNIIPRANKDHVIDAHGHKLLKLCKSTSLVIGNGRLHTDLNIGEYTFHSMNGSSTVDYLLLNIHDLQFISNFEILNPNEFSDHCGIKVHIESKQIPVLNNVMTNSETYLKWDENNIQNFKDLISNNQNLLNDITSSIEVNDTNQVVEQFTNFIKDHAFTVFGKTRNQTNSKLKNNFNKKQWFNNECYNARSQF